MSSVTFPVPATERVKSPFLSVTVPFFSPCTWTDAPTIGAPASSVTRPFICRSCAKTSSDKNKSEHVIANCFIWQFLIFKLKGVVMPD